MSQTRSDYDNLIKGAIGRIAICIKMHLTSEHTHCTLYQPDTSAIIIRF